MTLKSIGPGSLAGERRPGGKLLGKSSSPKDRLNPRPGQTARYLRWPVRNDDGHHVGYELLRIGPDLDAFIRQMAEESR